MISRGTAPDVTVYRLRCTCGFVASSLDHERMKAAMLDHVDGAHREVDLPSEALVCDPEEVK